MKRTIFEKVKNLFEHKAILLMYHRVAELQSDVWELAVSPDRFEQHLKVLKKMGNVVPLQQVANSIKSKRLSNNSISITFDDGYIDNFEIAKPLLEKYKIPATFFIASGQTEGEREFWWDELEHIFLFSAYLPSAFSMTLNEQHISFELLDESYLNNEMSLKHRLWKASSEEPPTMRAKLFYKVWEQLRPLSFAAQDKCLQMIRKWADSPLLARSDYRTMSSNELRELAGNNLFTVGSHTVSHPALAYHSADFQKKEIHENKKFLQHVTGRDVSLLAYPYGNYNDETMKIASESKFIAAFSTEEKTVKKGSAIYSLGRFQVKNLTGPEFNNQLKHWKLQ